MNPTVAGDARRQIEHSQFNYILFEEPDGTLVIQVVWNHSAFYALEERQLTAKEAGFYRKKGRAYLETLARKVSAEAVRKYAKR